MIHTALTGKKSGFISLVISKNMKMMKPYSSLSVMEISTLAMKFMPWQ